MTKKRECMMIDLKKFAGHKYRIKLDESATSDTERTNRAWYYQVPCKYGHVYVHGENVLGAYTDRPRLHERLAAIEGAEVHQRGDRELTVLLSPDRLDAACELLHARKRRQLSPEHREALAAGAAATCFRRQSERVPGPGIDA